MDCEHEFDVYNHGEVGCRLCKRRYPLAWAVDKIKADEEAQRVEVKKGSVCGGGVEALGGRLGPLSFLTLT